MTHKIDDASEGTPQEAQVQEDSDEMLPEYDFSEGVRGKHARALQKGYHTVVHHSDGTVTTTFHIPNQHTGEAHQQDQAGGRAFSTTESFVIVHRPESAMLEPTLELGTQSQRTIELPAEPMLMLGIGGSQAATETQVEYGYFMQLLRGNPLSVVDNPQRNTSKELAAER